MFLAKLSWILRPYIDLFGWLLNLHVWEISYYKSYVLQNKGEMYWRREVSPSHCQGRNVCWFSFWERVFPQWLYNLPPIKPLPGFLKLHVDAKHFLLFAGLTHDPDQELELQAWNQNTFFFDLSNCVNLIEYPCYFLASTIYFLFGEANMNLVK